MTGSSSTTATLPGRPKVVVVTSTRADYGHLHWLLRALEDDTRVETLLYVTGTHLSAAHGMTVTDVEADGHPVARRIATWEDQSTPAGIAAGLGRTVERFGAAFAADAPAVAVVLGDRAEALAIALAAVVAGVPVAHLHGGETSRGSLDEYFRHAITKLASLHFPATRAYAERIRQLGEDPAYVHALGAPGLDHVRRTPLLGREELSARLGLDISAPTALVAFHPVTTEPGSAARHVAALLEGIAAIDDLQAVFTGSNADEGGDVIDAALRAFSEGREGRYRFFPNLGTRAYLSCLAHLDVVVGNSSSGIIEAPSFGVPTVNVGVRQEGRVRATSVIDVPAEPAAIAAGIRRALSPEFRAQAARTVNPYDERGDGRVSERIAARIVEAALSGLPTSKRFHDLDAARWLARAT